MSTKEPSLDEYKMSWITYWANLPIIKEFEEATFKKMGQSSVRHAIITILSKGIEDEEPGSGRRVRRHVLSASEIMNILESEDFDLKVKKSNLYFHLENLENIEAIKVVDQVPTGKRFTTYYGRTAKVFYVKNARMDDEKVKEYSPIRWSDFKSLLLRMNPDKEVEIDKSLAQADGINKYDPNLFKNWIREFQKHTEGLDLNFVQFHGFLSILNRYTNDDTFEGLKKLAELLKIAELPDEDE
ncbi:MAG: hypothetical protein INQ03_11590 [Candidatus Heimdallarchaeota archaeon]|nr:hypothetical protein [Candidatus Heimdallarchaeota archaeon]